MRSMLIAKDAGVSETSEDESELRLVVNQLSSYVSLTSTGSGRSRDSQLTETSSSTRLYRVDLLYVPSAFPV
jgi:hypothetical protein